MSQEYEQFGDEWKDEMMKMKKPDIIDMYKRARLQLDAYKTITEWVDKGHTVPLNDLPSTTEEKGESHE